MKYITVLVTTNGMREARRIGDGLLKKKLCACVNIVPKVHSKYWWKGKLEAAAECLMIIKTTGASFPALEKTVKKLHSYTVPEIIALPIIKGNKQYLSWISASCKEGAPAFERPLAHAFGGTARPAKRFRREKLGSPQ